MSLPNHEALLIEPVRPGDAWAARARLNLHPAAASEGGAAFWGAYRGGRLVGVLQVTPQGGKSAIVSLGRMDPAEPPETAYELLSCGVDALRSAGVLVAQTLLETDHGPQAECFLAAGFRHVANLQFLVTTSDAFPQTPPGAGLTLVPYVVERHREFAQTIERTYVGSRDCLAMDTVRTIDDVLEGYQAAGKFDPNLWLVARHEDREIGCLLLSSDETASRSWELVYFGVVPEARGHGYGLELARAAQWLAGQAGATRVVLAVDAENAPAISVYAAAGFVTWGERSVFMRAL